ncbi:MAG: hypothetical protein H0X15_13955, partial [Acidobacteria bacterium]|nr:hypothetical protein [Acidobacteriota bacterium]
GTNVAGGILIANQYVEAIDKVNRSPLTAEQKAAATRDILTQAAATGGLMILGTGLGRKFVAPNKSELNLLLKNANLGNDLEQLVKNDLTVQKFFVAHGKDELNGIYNDYLLGVKTGKLKAGSFEQYLELRVVKQVSGRRNLDSHEGMSGVQEGKQIGHTTLKHVGKSERWLQDRIRLEGVESASSFYNKSVGNRTVGRFVKENKNAIQQWLKSKKTDPFKAVIDMKEDIGLVVNSNKKGTPLAAEKATKAEIVLVKDNSEHGWHLVTVKLQK